ncbi:hypothetical protein PACTADRAFT_46668 [Pachysolen tannophilus NRRL Y-2460]|uniref:Large ribosomal subunit protein mL59 domain-containing protein n=1 Tax=Pachysolen tannophilus NRRL Y-2460 TaxID=669874 RepID=A0A1E4TN06_PACTA|nr:hypothetical protein PACTADRAFT_46668 [Pachysolen tannophilus NRRL Y-2460]
MSLSAQQAFKKLPKKLVDFFTQYPPIPFKQYATETTLTTADDANPFLPNKHPVTNAIHDPIYSMRRQSDLFKLAYKFGVADLLPKLNNGKVFYEERYNNAKPLKGAVNPKGHKWERTYESRKQKIAEAVARADEIIIEARGNKYKRRLERKEKEQKTWY